MDSSTGARIIGYTSIPDGTLSAGAGLDSRPYTARMAPRIVNIPPIAQRTSSLMARSPEDHVEDGRHDEYGDREGDGPLVPRHLTVALARREGMDQPAQLLVRLGALGEQRDDQRRHEAAGPCEQRRPEVQRHLARVGVQHRAEKSALDT